MGINLPVRQVVLYDLQKFNGTDFGPLSTNTVWQRVGRAGRLGLDAEGEAVLFMPRWDRSGESYKNGIFEPIHSTLTKPVFLAEQLVAEIASGLSRTEPQLIAAFNQSLAAHENTLPDVRRALAEMLAAGMITLTNDFDTGARSSLRVTKLGRIATRHLLSPATVLAFKRVTDECPQLAFLDLLVTCAASNDCEPVLPVDFEELDALAASLSDESSVLLQLSHQKIEHLLQIDGKRLVSALKMALVMRGWTRSADVESVASQSDCYPFEVDRLRESMTRLLLAMSNIF
jgi:helicase